MKRSVLVAAFALSQVTLVQVSAGAAQDRPVAMNQGQMSRLDRDGNGAVDRPEYQAFMTSAFTNMDRNKDGSLRSEEVAQVLDAKQFAATDADRDGKLSQTEFLNRVMADFQSADRSGDGSLQ